MGEVEKPRVGRWARVAGSPAGPSVLQRRVQRLLVLVYLALVAMGIWGPSQPRVFWTMLLPLLPITIVLIGFGNWRRICPLAFWGELGSRVERSEQRRVPKWMELHFFALTFGFLLVMLSIRLLAINGDGHWLSRGRWSYSPSLPRVPISPLPARRGATSSAPKGPPSPAGA